MPKKKNTRAHQSMDAERMNTKAKPVGRVLKSPRPGSRKYVNRTLTSGTLSADGITSASEGTIGTSLSGPATESQGTVGTDASSHHEDEFINLVKQIAVTRFGRAIMLVVYSLFGGVLFITIEGSSDTMVVTAEGELNRHAYATTMKVLNRTKGLMTKSHFEEIVNKELSDFEQVIVANVDLVQHNKELSRFDFWTSLFFCATIFTTVGYGHISPKTGIGRAATICYAIFGIPLCLMVLFDLGKVLKGGFRFLWTFVIRLLKCPNVGAHKMDQEDDDNEEAEIDFNLPPLVAILVLLLYIFLGSFIYIQWERWRLLTAFYFIFITFSTVGFGDIVPEHPKYFMASSVYVFFGLSLVSMVINVFAEMLQTTLEEARATVGITAEGDDDEEER